VVATDPGKSRRGRHQVCGSTGEVGAAGGNPSLQDAWGSREEERRIFLRGKDGASPFGTLVPGVGFATRENRAGQGRIGKAMEQRCWTAVRRPPAGSSGRGERRGTVFPSVTPYLAPSPTRKGHPWPTFSGNERQCARSMASAALHATTFNL